MQKTNVEHLQAQLKELHKAMTRLSSEDPIDGLVSIIHRPGWTTLAEEAFFAGIVDAMLAQTKTLLGMKSALMSGASKVELNPQPLPPKQ